MAGSFFMWFLLNLVYPSQNHMDAFIREATIADMDDIIRFTTMIAEHEQSVFNAEEKSSQLSEYMFGDEPKISCLIAMADNVACGYATYSTEFSLFLADNYLRLNSLFVLPEYRGWGIGEQFINRLFEVAKERKCKGMQCFTPDFNIDAIDFYRRLGAKTRSTIRFYFDLDTTP